MMTPPRPESAFKTVHIYDQTYHLSGPDLAEVERLAQLVDSRMRAVAGKGRTVDSLRVAVLAALNLADELSRTQERLQRLESTEGVAESVAMRNRAASLRGLLDEVLDEELRTGS